LIKVPELHARRAPGNTCTTAIREGRPVEDSKGCGGVMRIAPAGLYFDNSHVWGESKDESRLCAARTAATIARITHGHDLGYIPAAALAYIINSILYYEYLGSSALSSIVIDCVAAMDELYSQSHYIRDFHGIMARAVELAQGSKPDIFCIQELGEGWVAEETLAIAVFCALRHKDSFDDAIIAAVNHDGDSDSTGSAAGNILGAYYGYDALPARFIKNLELKGVILEMADDLWHDPSIKDASRESDADDTAWKVKYVYSGHA
jgi:ADP-ribosylglycohydrolase